MKRKIFVFCLGGLAAMFETVDLLVDISNAVQGNVIGTLFEGGNAVLLTFPAA